MNIVPNLNTGSGNRSVLQQLIDNPVQIILNKYRNHPSVAKIKENKGP